MENIDEFTGEIMDRLYDINKFTLCCMFNDICLKDYHYRHRTHEWYHNKSEFVYTLYDMRMLLTVEIKELFKHLQSSYLIESQRLSPTSEQHGDYQRKIKKIAEIIILINTGDVFKEFVDCYKNHYFV